MSETKIYSKDLFKDALIEKDIKDVSEILKEKGYDPINQIVGYLMSGDPGYITNYKGARKTITSFDRTKLLEVIVADYIK
ncbi:MAG: IreB family regulatory phosphoprotein [Mycoplasmatota bacterium]